MHIELTEMLRCPEAHREEMLVLSTGEVRDRMVRSGLVGCPVCHKEYPIARGIVNFRRSRERVSKESSGPRLAYVPPSPLPSADATNLQALLQLSGPGGYVVLVGSAVRQAPRLSSLMEGIHFVGINAPLEMDEQPMLSLLYANEKIPLRTSIARGVGVSSPDSIVKSFSSSRTFFGVSNLARSRSVPITSRSIFACTSASCSNCARVP